MDSLNLVHEIKVYAGVSLLHFCSYYVMLQHLTFDLWTKINLLKTKGLLSFLF